MKHSWRASSRRSAPAGNHPRTVFLANRKTSVRLPPVMWDALNDIANHLKLPRDNLLQQIDRDREPEQGLTEAIRVYILEFYRARVKL